MRTPAPGTFAGGMITQLHDPTRGSDTTVRALLPGEHRAEVDGATLHHTVRGSGPVLLLPSPGRGPSSGHLLPQPVLERHCTVVHVDSRHSATAGLV
jgi:hypothetical protein